MASLNRQNIDRRNPDRRDPMPAPYSLTERRETNRRSYLDRRNDQMWRFSWLRMSISQQLAA